MLIVLLLFLVSNLQASEIPYRIDPEAVKWAQELKAKPFLSSDFDEVTKQKEEIKKQIAQQAGMDQTAKKTVLQETKGKKCSVSQNLVPDQVTQLYVFVSFSLPDEVWLSLSKVLEMTSGVLVLRGLPHNSFTELSIQLQRLQKLGVKACIQINPILFRKYAIQDVPSFVAVDKDETFDKVTGNVSLFFAMEKMAAQGETTVAKEWARKP